MAELGEERLLALTAPPVRKLVVGYEIRQGGALFLGPTGAGKSTGCAALGHRILQQARDRSISEQAPKRHYAGYNAGSLIWWARANDLANARARHELGSEAPAIIAAKHPKLLILDDLGWDLGRDGTISEVIAERYDAGKVTIATSGFRFEQLVERYGEATIRKILESGGVKGKIVSLFPSAAKGEPCA
ncbi:MAG TPA: hypothetical protein VHE30_25930 [Polyangiaceae bacterium]|nr:hypothetical protein [Polyangiaceae bacterium]